MEQDCPYLGRTAAEPSSFVRSQLHLIGAYMGAWGPGIFDDEVALDVRDAYLDLLASGHPVLGASQLVLERHALDLSDVDTAPVVWLALAATQHEYGAFGEGILDRALEILHGDSALRPFEGSAQMNQRRMALTRLATKLRSPLLKPRRPRRRKPVSPPPSHTVSAPDGRATITVHELTSSVSARERAQVTCQLVVDAGAGGGHIALFACTWDQVKLDWVDADTARITFPTGTLVEPPEPSAHRPTQSFFYFGRTLAIRYLEI